MKTCDTCGKSVNELFELRDFYQTTQFKEVCHDCKKLCDKHLDKINDAHFEMRKGFLKRFLETLRR